MMEAFEWCEAELNRRHKDFQSFALPTELSHPIFFHDLSDNPANQTYGTGIFQSLYTQRFSHLLPFPKKGVQR